MRTGARTPARRLRAAVTRRGRSGAAPACEVPLAALSGILHDQRTGVLTHDAWLAQALTVGHPGAVLVLDLDHFKTCNDRHGHPAGDRVLAHVAWTVRTHLRHVDLLGRYGGDELVALLGGRSGTAAVADICERLRHGIATQHIRLPDGDTVQVTASVGAAVPGPGHNDLHTLIVAADRALYRAKRAGRDRTHVVEPEERCPRARP